jgi:acetyltransferase-like isoleucine patch superfamily enzyme
MISDLFRKLAYIRVRIVSSLLVRIKVIDCLYCIFHGLRWDSSWTLYGFPSVRMHHSAGISIGKRFVACSRIYGNSLGVNQPVILNASGRGAVIAIGDDVGMSGCTVCASVSVRIGNRVMIGSGALLTDSDAHPLHPDDRNAEGKTKAGPIVVEDDAFIGARAIVLKGVTVGRGAVVGAGSVVACDVPPMAIVAGNPARVLRVMENRA